MPEGAGLDGPKGASPPELSLWQRILLRLPHLRRDRAKRPLGERLRSAMLKPVDPDAPPPTRKGAYELSGEELEIEAAALNDKERLIGLVAAPLATLIGFLVAHEDVVHDTKRLVGGAVNKNYVNPSIYYDLFLVLIAMSVLMLVMALLRKRLYLGMVIALYGLAIFNLHYWGFGVPFVMVGSWYLVRAYRLQRSLKEATAGGSSGSTRPPSNKRYTPPTLAPKQVPPAKARRTRRAG